MWLDFAEDQAKRRKQAAVEKAAAEYEKFEERRRIELENSGGAETIKQLEDLTKNPPSSEK